jgi:hypothetical protein
MKIKLQQEIDELEKTLSFKKLQLKEILKKEEYDSLLLENRKPFTDGFSNIEKHVARLLTNFYTQVKGKSIKFNELSRTRYCLDDDDEIFIE